MEKSKLKIGIVHCDNQIARIIYGEGSKKPTLKIGEIDTNADVLAVVAKTLFAVAKNIGCDNKQTRVTVITDDSIVIRYRQIVGKLAIMQEDYDDDIADIVCENIVQDFMTAEYANSLHDFIASVIACRDAKISLNFVKIRNLTKWDVVVDEDSVNEGDKVTFINGSTECDEVRCIDCSVLSGEFVLKQDKRSWYVDRQTKSVVVENAKKAIKKAFESITVREEAFDFDNIEAESF